MTQTKSANTPPSAHLFNVDLLIESESSAKALEQLIQLLNKAPLADYRIISGIELGRLIETLEKGSTAEPIAIDIPTVQLSAAVDRITPVTDRIKAYIANNALIRISVNKGFGVHLNLPCRIINLDESSQMLTVYHVDEKQVYMFSLNEIDDFL